MKKLLILPVLGLAFALLAPAAQAADPDPSQGTPVECWPEHLTQPITGACQGPDTDPDPFDCQIQVWVESASCIITPTSSSGTLRSTVPGGAGWGRSIAFAELGDDQWHAHAHMTITDLSTGQVVAQASDTETSPLSNPSGSKVKGLVGDISVPFNSGGPFLCEITGTHSLAGALPVQAGTHVTGRPGPRNMLMCTAR